MVFVFFKNKIKKGVIDPLDFTLRCLDIVEILYFDTWGFEGFLLFEMNKYNRFMFNSDSKYGKIYQGLV